MTPLEFLRWGESGALQVDGAEVPPDQVWLVQTCGIATNDPRPFDYRMQIVRSGHYHPLHCNPQPTGSTPVLAVERAFLMMPGDMLKARVNAGGDFGGMALLYSGWTCPLSDLSRLLGVATTPDLSVFVAQCQAAASALAAIQEPISG